MQKTTIENKHKEKLKQINQLRNENEIKDKIEKIQNKKTLTDNINEILKFDKDIYNLKDELKRNVEKQEEINYFLNVIPILNKYTTDYTDNKTNVDKEQNILNNFIVSSKGKEKGALYNDFMNVVENKCLDNIEKNNFYICKKCQIPKVISYLDSSMICPTCGVSDTYFDTGINNLSYEQEINSEGNINFAYKRINHFNEWLAQFQAKESTEIPDELLDKLRNEFHKNKIKSTNEITKSKVKQYLKVLKYNKYYEHIPHITNILSGNKPPSMTADHEEQLRIMFRNIQEPFEKNKPKERLNFLSYSFCLYKFCELLGYDHLLCNFPLLKSREKLHQQDIIWKKICYDLKWEFIATV